MKVLSIGNSFSQDAHRWLKDICVNGGVEADFYNLYIGGCSLERHWNEFCSGAESYEYQINAQKVRMISLKEALSAEAWDIVTFQQASHYSGMPETFHPWLENLAAEVRKACPNARFYFFQTWAYEIDYGSERFDHFHRDQQEMYRRLVAACRAAAEQIGGELIPVGVAVQKVRETVPEFDYKNGGLSLNRDGFHLSHLYGRYLAGLVWYRTLFGGDPTKITFVPEYEGEKADPALLKLIREAL